MGQFCRFHGTHANYMYNAFSFRGLCSLTPTRGSASGPRWGHPIIGSRFALAMCPPTFMIFPQVLGGWIKHCNSGMLFLVMGSQGTNSEIKSNSVTKLGYGMLLAFNFSIQGNKKTANINAKNDVYKNGYKRRSCTSKTAKINCFVRFVIYCIITTCVRPGTAPINYLIISLYFL